MNEILNKENWSYKNKEPYFETYEFLRKLKWYRDENKITWQELAKEAGVSCHTMKMILKGKLPTLFNLIKICNLIGENIYDFISYTNDKTYTPLTLK